MNIPPPARAVRLRTLLLYSHDTYGLGHLRRNLAIARHMLDTTHGLQVVLLSGSPVSSYFAAPKGLTVVPLPSVTKQGNEQYAPRNPALSLDLLRRTRTAIIADVLARLRPDVFLIDHAPAGMGGELRPVFDKLAAISPRTRVILGLRDVLDEPCVVRRVWREQGIPELLDRVYDDVLVYGVREMLDLGRAYGLSAQLGDRLRYCGYLGRPEHRVPAPPRDATGQRFVLGTAGGGEDGRQLLLATLAAARALDVAALLVTGPLMSAVHRAELSAAAAGRSDVEVVEFVPQLREKMVSASAVVTMGGYNTLCEVVGTGVPAVVIPRTSPRREQAIRAQLFADRGLLDVVPGGPELSQRVALALRTCLTTGTARPRFELRLDGLHRLREHLTAAHADGMQRRARRDLVSV